MNTEPRKRGLRVSNGGRVACILLFAALCSGADAATIEKPVYAKLKGMPIKDNPVLSYVLLGQLDDGTPALQKISPSTVRFYTRFVLFQTGSGVPIYQAEELNCRTGMWAVVGLGAGSTDHFTAVENPLRASVKEMNPRNLPVYREVCTTVEIQPAW